MKKTLSILLVLVLTLSLVTLSAVAADKKTDASIEFTAGDITIIDPEGPGVVVPPAFNDFKAINLDFGTHTITGSGVVTPTLLNKKLSLILEDLRGAGTLWNIKTSISIFNEVDALGGITTADTLKGFSINLSGGDTVIKGNASQINPPTAVAAITLDAVTLPASIFKSDALGSQGMWGVQWDPELTVLPGQEKAGNHLAAITWSIENTH